MGNPIMHSNLLCGTLSSLIKVYISSTRLLFFHLTSVTVITTSLLEVYATIPFHRPVLREVYVRFLDAS